MKATLSAFSLLLAGFSVYVVVQLTLLPQPNPEEYLTRVQGQDWLTVDAMHADEEGLRAARSAWKKLRKEQGVIQSWSTVSFSQTIGFSIDRQGRIEGSRSIIVYRLKCERGPAHVTVTMQPGWRSWKVLSTQVEYQ